MKETFAARGTRVCETAQDTKRLGAELGQALEAGDLVILRGPLGAGKTTITQGIAEGMGVTGRVTSPTFVIARVHTSRGSGPALIHVDAYRLIGEGSSGDPMGELDALDLDTDLADAAVVAEWGEGFVEQLADTYLLLTLDRETEARVVSWEVVSPCPEGDVG
ncbi:tRNA threonylcarbamoyladenosine biosynthesis protein TsaE [Corynebacterium capitovis DSM 44611]|uniref:tRNA (adenosine(37)-N6)-threonylcarbamoyltransferase complex ATPase subunit type 1 TsaE n=1 Tax=Corynebacterium capitovis TaxID=131081 RepID=UPI00037318E8|nr:tRNA (adenosine(37)-N6)-threonylcarbamoyltransferase complex ATPase subunit type 1 TsaE [Corynebacterium capitovis]WKD56918.1 tRNA threonylcarbamoyladenosine biosynthesis protein TsaE [Corynebacterium capitovis DSM 44611]